MIRVAVVWVIHCIFHPHNQSFSYYEFHSIFCILFQFHYSILVIFQIFFVHLKYFLGQIIHCLQENQFTTHANKSTRLIPRRSKSCSCRIINIRGKKKITAKQLFFHIQVEEKKSCLGALFSHPSGLEFDPRKLECDLCEANQCRLFFFSQHFSLLINTRIPPHCCSNCLKVIYSHQSSRISRVVNFIFITKSGLKKSIRFILFEFSTKPNF